MREILFRGKIIELCEYQGQWLEGFYAVENGKPFIAIPKENGLNGFYCDPETIGQYTGLKDLHGTRIFEGDVVTHKNYAFDVYYNTEYAGFYPFYDADSGAGYGVEAKNCEIIGNVFDNSLEELQNGNQRIPKRQWRIGTGELKNET